MKLPTSGEVHLWHIAHEGDRSIPPVLSQDEEIRANAFRFARDQARYRLTQTRKRQIFASYLNCPPKDLTFEIGRYGKPEVKGLAFSISHTDGLSLLAVHAKDPVGVDLEMTSPSRKDAALEAQILTPQESASYFSLPEKDRQTHFFRIWTAKEAYLKALGFGLQIEPHHVETDFPELSTAHTPEHSLHFLTGISQEGYCAHLATKSQITTVETMS
jgi:4'-phosphopantetheinyl transferase